MRPALLALIIVLLTSACVQPASTSQPFKGQNPFTPEAAAHLCTAADLQTSSSAHNETGIVTIGVTLINQSENTCNLQSPPQVSLRAVPPLDLQLIQTKADAPTLSISPGESVILTLSWRNYCGPALKNDLKLHLALEGSEPLNIQTKLLVFPRCEDGKAPSTLTINPYSYPP